MQLAHLNWQEAEKVLADPETLVVIPVGSTEQHGPIGPLGTDWLIPEEFCRRLDGRMEKLSSRPSSPSAWRPTTSTSPARSTWESKR